LTIYVTNESNAQKNKLKTVVVAMIARKRTRQTGKRSWGRKPTVYANEEIPEVAFCGRVNNVFGMPESMNIGEFLSLNWPAKSEGGSNVGVETGFQCFQELSLP